MCLLIIVSSCIVNNHSPYNMEGKIRIMCTIGSDSTECLSVNISIDIRSILSRQWVDNRSTFRYVSTDISANTMSCFAEYQSTLGQ